MKKGRQVSGQGKTGRAVFWCFKVWSKTKTDSREMTLPPALA
jgi:hypothetical protein